MRKAIPRDAYMVVICLRGRVRDMRAHCNQGIDSKARARIRCHTCLVAHVGMQQPSASLGKDTGVSITHCGHD